MGKRGTTIFENQGKESSVSENTRFSREEASSDRPLSRAKKAVFGAITLLILLLLVDAACYVIVTSCIPSRIKVRVGNGSVERRVTERQQPGSGKPRLIQSPEKPFSGQAKSQGYFMFHPVLGWDYPPDIVFQDVDDTICSHGPNGERTTCTSYETTTILTYGDSFTYCPGVKDSETWQTFLGQKIKQNVLNFGVGGYGTDQALLKYQFHGHRGAKIVMLGIFPENINRIVNIYRPFYVYHESRGLTKPRFIRDGNGFKLLSNPLTTVDDVARLLDPDFLRQLGQFDYWYQLDQRLPPLSFPYAYALLEWRKPILQQLSFSASRLLHLNSRPAYAWNLFDEPEPFKIMCHIVDNFVNTAQSRGSIPVIVILPHEDQIQELMDNRVGRHDRLVDYMKGRQYRLIDVVRSMADMNPDRSKLKQWYKGHATREGNEIVAEIVASYLGNHPNLLQ